ncbi:MoxR-like ATPase [Ureibacillus xyleni]|uniref:MoxR-like ATPase n=1 Tax=Ureibacillus xyleni TaxID=614648 RepID=A0A285THM6_9BACL|nr:AAA family ATPase [Ureibacillus xyleni]SOC21583.1 MoxR-like ATPase [Ureibacillus xyleni]
MNIQFKQIQDSLNATFFDRNHEVEALLTAVLARQHVLFIGPAGTGKSALSSMLGQIVTGSTYFQQLLTPYSTPEELFGVLSLKDLEQGRYVRNVEGMLPLSHFAFIDEIFKANSAILNSLLTLINERLYYNNGVPIQSPLMTIVGSSNEYIEEGEGLEALFDRFLLRYEVDYIKENSSFIQMMKSHTKPQVPTMNLGELKQHQQAVDQVNISDAIYDLLAQIRQALVDEGIRPSDRRFKQSLSLLQAKAYLQGRQDVSPSDLQILSNTLWETTDQKTKTKEIVKEHSQDVVMTFIERMNDEFNEILQLSNQALNGEHSQDQISELLLKGKTLSGQVQDFQAKHPARLELVDLRNRMQQELLKLTSAVIGF